MKEILWLLFYVLIMFQSARGFEFEESELESFSKLYERWRIHYSVERSLDEMDNRLKVFKDNVMYVHTTMTKPYNLKLNKFTDWTFEEFSNTYVCPTEYDSEGLEECGSEQVETKPTDSIDWREKGAVTGVKNQGNCCKSNNRKNIKCVYYQKES